MPAMPLQLVGSKLVCNTAATVARGPEVVSGSSGHVLAVLVVMTAVLGSPVHGQAQLQTRLPSTTPQPGLAPNSSLPGSGSSSPSLAPLPGNQPAASLGQPQFDPYSTAPGSNWFGSLWGSGPGGSATGGTFANPSTGVWGPSTAVPGAGSTTAGGLGGYGAPFGGSTAGGAVPPGGVAGAPPSLFPNGLTNPSWITPQGQIVGTPLRFLQGPRFRHGWLAGDEGREVDINETDVSVILTFPEFLYSTQPLYIAPSFTLTLWDNPEGPDFPPAADLPAQTYAAYLDNYWSSDPTRLLGAEVGVRLGLWTDFDTLSVDSFRIQGLGLFRVRLTPTLTMKLGAAYLDRNKVKLVPAGGFLWEPNPQTRVDAIIPQPKFARYITTLGNQDVWWYVTGEYGGNAWTIERAFDGASDRIDYNDIRLIAGLEWGSAELIRQRRRLGFVEVGWVTEREVIYVRRPEDSFTIRDTVMLRAGIGY